MKKLLVNLKQPKGIALVETIIAAAIIGVSAFFIINSSGLWNQRIKKIQVSGAEVAISDIIIQSALANGRSLQVDYTEKSAKEILDDLMERKELPMAWTSQGRLLPAEQCPTCPGRYAFVVKPVPQYRGLYQVVIRMVMQGPLLENNFKDYSTLITK